MTRLVNCVICCRPLPPEVARIQPFCNHWRCRTEHQKQHRQQRRAEQKALEREWISGRFQARAERDRIAADSQVNDAAEYQPILLPANLRPITELPEERREQFKVRLTELVNRALSAEPVDACDTVGDDERILPVLGKACATCRGHCCLKGGLHAFLDVPSIQRYARKHPAKSARELVADYTAHLPDQTYLDSCVFHSESGCALPHAMRSVTCNTALCNGLVEIRSRIRSANVSKFFLTAMSDEQIIRTAFVDQDKITE